MQTEIAMKVENYVFAHLNTSQNKQRDVVEIIIYMQGLHNGGTQLFWTFLDKEFQKVLSVLSLK